MGEQWPGIFRSARLRGFKRSGTMLRYVSTTYGESRVGEPKSKDNENFREMHIAHVAQLERVIFIIDRMLRQLHFKKYPSVQSDYPPSFSDLLIRILRRCLLHFSLLDPGTTR